MKGYKMLFFSLFVWRKSSLQPFESKTATRERNCPSPFQIQLFIYFPLPVLYATLDILLLSVFKHKFPSFMHFFMLLFTVTVFLCYVFFNSCQFIFCCCDNFSWKSRTKALTGDHSRACVHEKSWQTCAYITWDQPLSPALFQRSTLKPGFLRLSLQTLSRSI